MPEKGAECICKDFGFEYEGGECQPKYGADVKIVKVTEVKFNQSYNEKFADKDSTEFKSKKAELEILLKITICSYISCIDIIVVAITKGSINVEFNAIFPSNVTTATPAAVTTATKQALSDPRLQVLNPDVNSLPKAQGKFQHCNLLKIFLACVKMVYIKSQKLSVF